MLDFTDRELIRYVLGDARSELANAIEERARTDEELAAQIELLRLGIGNGGEAGEQTAPLPMQRAPGAYPRPAFLRRKWLVAASLLVVLAGAAWAAYVALIPRPLLQDNFNSDWIDPQKWDVARGRPGIRAIDGHLRLRNRGSLVTRREFPDAVEVEFDWRWVDHAEDPLYSENLNVALRTSGKHTPEYDFRILDGIIVQFSTLGARVTIFSRSGERFQVDSDEGGVPMPADAWHHIRITDDGTTISVYMTGPKIDRQYTKTPVLQARLPGKFPSQRIAFYNREVVNNATHETHIDNVTIRSLPIKQKD